MALLDLLGRRWALRVLWELRDGPVPFRALQQRCDGMSSSVLNQRLAELRAAERGGALRRRLRADRGGRAPARRASSRCRRGRSGGRPADRPARAARRRAAPALTQASSSSVTGPSLTSSTAMCAPNTPRGRRPGWQNSSYSGSACSAGAAAVKLGRLPAPRVAVERELAHAQDLALAERLVHVAGGVREDPQRAHLRGQSLRLLGRRPRG